MHVGKATGERNQAGAIERSAASHTRWLMERRWLRLGVHAHRLIFDARHHRWINDEWAHSQCHRSLLEDNPTSG